MSDATWSATVNDKNPLAIILSGIFAVIKCVLAVFVWGIIVIGAITKNR